MPSDLKAAQELARKLAGTHAACTDAVSGAVVSLSYAHGEATAEDFARLLEHLGPEGLCALSRYRKRKNYPFAQRPPLADTAAVRRELEGLLAHFKDALELPDPLEAQARALGMGEVFVRTGKRWVAHRLNLEQLPALMRADEVAWTDLKTLTGPQRYAFLCPWEWQQTGRRRVRLADSRDGAEALILGRS